jgi:hypothetical protein
MSGHQVASSYRKQSRSFEHLALEPCSPERVGLAWFDDIIKHFKLRLFPGANRAIRQAGEINGHSNHR